MRSCQIDLFSDESIHLGGNNLSGYPSVLIESILIKKKMGPFKLKWSTYLEWKKMRFIHS